MPGSYLLKELYLQIISKNRNPCKMKVHQDRTDLAKEWYTAGCRNDMKITKNEMKMKIHLIQKHREMWRLCTNKLKLHVT